MFNSNKSTEFLAGLFAAKSYMGLKYQLVINMNTHKFFTFTVGDSHFTNVNLNLLWWVRETMWLFWVTFRRIPVNHLNEVFDSFSRSCNTLIKFMLVEWGVLSQYLDQGKTGVSCTEIC